MIQYNRGVVEEYDERAGYGLIRSEDPPSNERFLVHRQSLRTGFFALRPGERVLFRTKDVDRGTLATDVHSEFVDAPDSAFAQERVVGTIVHYNANRGFGFVHIADGRDAFFHVSYLADPSILHTHHASVTCRLVMTERGLQAQDIAVESLPPNQPAGHESLAPAVQDYLAQALAARERRNHDEAAALYERGLRETPNVALVLSYAATEKNWNRKQAAMRVYEEGIRLFPDHAKLREDAGILAASLGDHSKALKLLHESLEICRRTGGTGAKGVLLALARTSYNSEALEDAVDYYEQALHLFDRGSTRLPEGDLMQMHLAKIRTWHHRGNLTVQFLESVKLRIVRATLLENNEGAEFIVELHPELCESYGMARYLMVRCFFKTIVNRADLDALDRSLADPSNVELCDPQVALVVVASLPNDLQRILWKRVEERRQLRPAIIPLQQSEIETGASSQTVLLGVLDRWLYRRDLFAINSPVVGRRFFGRGKPLAELRQAIATSTPTAVFGLRKVGKTSLLQESQRRSSETGDIVVYVDLLRVPSDVTDCGWLYWKIASDLRHETEKRLARGLEWRLGTFTDYLDIPKGFPIATAFDSDLTRMLRQLAVQAVSPRPKLVLLLDEIEGLLPTKLGKRGLMGFFDFFGYLRGIAQESDNFVLIITGANASITETSQFDGRDNPVFNFFREIYLPLLERSECWLMVRELGRGMGMRFRDEALDFIYSLTGGHPFFARQLCSFIAEQQRERPIMIERALIESMISHYLDVRSADFQEIIDRLKRDFPDEQAVCVALARAGGSLPINAVRDQTVGHIGSTLRHLKGYQILATNDRRAFLTIDLLTRWLRQRYVHE